METCREDEHGNLILENGTVIEASERTRTEIYSRVVGYMRPIDFWNPGKVAEFHDRKTFNVGIKSSKDDESLAA